ncbi:hypothetical protein AAFF_G00164110 [Aldrovandia affinis]|uniref:Uncharacterized protein n=1 Tax=Aldrovandia affinis TaxID=143900 RepID=A0AAD7T048_9TELE|nr:hypothetical protein AAFF_G00164110 [Aldrovandia affinis]
MEHDKAMMERWEKQKDWWEEGSSDRSSSSCSPQPGDTLPWNMAKHQRLKRSQSASGEVLDPAERAIFRIAAQSPTDRRSLAARVGGGVKGPPGLWGSTGSSVPAEGRRPSPSFGVSL